jgi:hypothetical protein
MSIHTVSVSDFPGEYPVILASSNGYKYLMMLTFLTGSGCPSVKFQVKCKDKLVYEGFTLAAAVEEYNKVDAG